MFQITRHPSFGLPGLVLGVALVIGGAPAFGQEYTVIGQTKSMDDSSLSATVHAADLDLTTATGRSILHQRINRAAAEVCHELGEGSGPVGLAFTCQEEAVRRAAPMERAMIQQARTSAPERQQASSSYSRVASVAPSR